MPAAGVMALVSGDVHKTCGKYLGFFFLPIRGKIDYMSREQLPATSISPLPAQLVPFVTVRHDELHALRGSGDMLVASFKRARGGHGLGTWMLQLNVPEEMRGSGSLCSTQAVGSGFAELSAGRNLCPSKAMPCGMLMAGLCLLSIFLNR